MTLCQTEALEAWPFAKPLPFPSRLNCEPPDRGADTAAALRVLRSNARIDLLITDVGLPGGMNGRQMADAAREVRPELKVLFITGYAENAAIGNGLLAAGMAVLTKPFALDALGSRIKDMIAK